MAWVTFPDGSRQKVERVDKSDADTDLNNLLAERARAAGARPRRERLATFDEVIDAWMAAGAPRPPTGKRNRHAKKKVENTLIKIGYLLDGHVRPHIGKIKVERTSLQRIEAVFQEMDDREYATSTIDHTWSYLNQACEFGIRQGLLKTNPVTDVLLPEARPAKKRKAFTEDQLDVLLVTAIPADTRPAMWLSRLTGPTEAAPSATSLYRLRLTSSRETDTPARDIGPATGAAIVRVRIVVRAGLAPRPVGDPRGCRAKDILYGRKSQPYGP